MLVAFSNFEWFSMGFDRVVSGGAHHENTKVLTHSWSVQSENPLKVGYC